MKFDEVKALVVSNEVHHRKLGNSSESALSREIRGRTRGISKSRFGRLVSRGRSQGRTSKSTIKYWNCIEVGHLKRDCKAPSKEQTDDRSANISTDTASTENVLDALILSVSSPLDSWVLDSRASFHSCSNSELMEDYTSDDFGEVYLADDEPLKIVGKGNVRITTLNRTTLKLHGVRHIPGLKRNLLSIRQLDDEGYVTAFGQNSWKITKGAMVVARGRNEGTLYITMSSKDYVAAVGEENDADLWHCRLGHMSEKGMQVMCTKGRLPRLKSVELGLCEDCVFGKQKRVSFSKVGKEPKKEKLELMHSNLWGPAPVTSLGGASYYMTFIDDCTRKNMEPIINAAASVKKNLERL